MGWARGPRQRRVQGECAMRSMIAGVTCHSLCVSVSLWLVISTGAPSKASAQDGTVEQLVATALERSPELRTARADIQVASGQVTQAGLRPNPTLAASRMLMTGEQHQTLIEVEWPLDLYRRSARVGAAQREV